MVFRRKKDLKVLMSRHTGEKLFLCHRCSAQFIRRDDFKARCALHSSKKRYECTHCGAKFRNRKALANHVISHSSEKVLSCPHCRATFGQAFVLKHHMCKHRGEKLDPHVPLDADCATTSQEIYLQTHSQDERNFACSECAAKFECASELRKHLDVHLAEDMELNDNGDDSSEFLTDFNLWEHVNVLSVDSVDLQNHSVRRNYASPVFSPELNGNPGLRGPSQVDLIQETSLRSHFIRDLGNIDYTSPEFVAMFNCSVVLHRLRKEDLPTQTFTDVYRSTIAQETDAQIDLPNKGLAFLECSAEFESSSERSKYLDVHFGKNLVSPKKMEEINDATLKFSATSNASLDGSEHSDAQVVEDSRLQNHSIVESEERNHTCSLCPARFQCSSDLAKHLYVHSYLQKLNGTF